MNWRHKPRKTASHLTRRRRRRRSRTERQRFNRTQMELVRAALLDAGAEEQLWSEALASVVHFINRSRQAGLDMTPLEAVTGRRPSVSRFRG